jgi:ankyrin repeat protein
MLACQSAKIKHFNILLKYGASIFLKDTVGQSAIHHSINDFTKFSKNDVNPKIKNKRIQSILKKLILLGADINECDSYFNDSPLVFAVCRNALGCAKILVRNGCDVNFKYRDETILYRIFKDKHLNKVTKKKKWIALLINYGADPHLKLDGKQSAYEVAPTKYKKEIDNLSLDIKEPSEE